MFFLLFVVCCRVALSFVVWPVCWLVVVCGFGVRCVWLVVRCLSLVVALCSFRGGGCCLSFVDVYSVFVGWLHVVGYLLLVMWCWLYLLLVGCLLSVVWYVLIVMC